ncbi:MAG: hypothetical protein IPN89_09470 [Saprospiraceae bacterium]|nr:hypothetical protein [Saprospiraceae bacterium]
MGWCMEPDNIKFTSANVTNQQVGIITVTPQGSCPGTPLMFSITVNPLQDATFTFPDFCAGATNGPTSIATSGGTFSFMPNPGGGVIINSLTGVITGGVAGSSYTVQYNKGPCLTSY